MAHAARQAPGRKRVQRAGVILMAIGAFVLLPGILIATVGPLKVDDLRGEHLAPYAAAPGGDLVVVSDLAGPVTLHALNGSLIAQRPLVDGEAAFSLNATSVANVTVADPSGARSRIALVLETDDVRLELGSSQPPGHQDRLAGTGLLVQLCYLFGGAAAFLGAAMVGGGFAAFRRKWRGLALAGAVAGLVVGLVLGIAFFPVGLLFALPLAYAFAAVIRGRPVFA